jgi:D-alanyl-D-alanine carboxypeptidase
MRLIATLLLILALPLHAATPAQRLDQLLKTYFPADKPGAAVIVTVNGKPFHRGAYGMANLELKVPLESDHVFRLASVTKQFTAAAILKLVEDEKLTLDTKLSSILPGWPDTITIEHLLTHTSGVPSFTALPDYQQNKRDDVNPPEMLARFKSLPLEFEPGTQFRYSNSGYYLLGQVIEKLSGMPYGGFLIHHFFFQLGMSSTTVDDSEKVIPNRVQGYTLAGGTWHNAPFISMKQPYSAGALLSTTGDLAKWYDGLLAGKVVKQELLDRAWTPSKVSQYGYGWYNTTLWGHPAIEHGGGIEGFSAYAVAIPSKRVVVAVLANSDTPPVDPAFVAAQAASFALGQPYDPKAITLSAESLDAYIGTYRSSDGTQRTICREDNQLVSQRLGPGGRRSPITPMGKDRFFFTASFLQAHFERDANGNVTGVEFERPGAPAEHAVRTSRTCN